MQIVEGRRCLGNRVLDRVFDAGWKNLSIRSVYTRDRSYNLP